MSDLYDGENTKENINDFYTSLPTTDRHRHHPFNIQILIECFAKQIREATRITQNMRCRKSPQHDRSMVSIHLVQPKIGHPTAQHEYWNRLPRKNNDMMKAKPQRITFPWEEFWRSQPPAAPSGAYSQFGIAQLVTARICAYAVR